MIKTNAMRLLDAANISYRANEYEVGDNNLSIRPDVVHAQVFKTLITRGDRNGINVFCIPIEAELDLKKAASVSKNKKVEMVAMKEILGLTGYVRGGCSPIGMKKTYPTFIDEVAILFDEIAVSGGVRGTEIIINFENLRSFVDGEIVDVSKFQ